VVDPPRPVPIALKYNLKAELDRLESEIILKVVTEPTTWVSDMSIVRIPTGKLCICIDPKDLNKATRHNHYPIPMIDEILPDLREARVFSVFDVRNGFWHVGLDEESSLLTTFITPFGCYMIHFGSIPASVVFFPTRHVASITRYLMDCPSKKHKIAFQEFSSRISSSSSFDFSKPLQYGSIFKFLLPLNI
jgi:hypothetical protein